MLQHIGATLSTISYVSTALKCCSCIVTFRVETSVSSGALLLPLEFPKRESYSVASLSDAQHVPLQYCETATVRKEPNKPACQPPSQMPSVKTSERENTVSYSPTPLPPFLYPKQIFLHLLCVIPENRREVHELWDKNILKGKSSLCFYSFGRRTVAHQTQPTLVPFDFLSFCGDPLEDK